MLRKKIFVFILFFVFSSPAEQEVYYGQINQDEFMHKNFFLDKIDGVFIDVGASRGIRFSNSLFFEKRGWHCVCIEPLPNAFAELIKNRACLCIQACISDTEGIAEFLEINGACEMLSGLTSKYDPRHIQRIAFEVQQNHDSCRIIKVPCFTLNFILEKTGITHVHILKLDVEGAEKIILESIDFDRYTFDVICVEDNYQDPELCKILEAKGFVLVKILRLDPNNPSRDLIFRNKKFLSH